jgi:hypothetical protein
MHDATQHNPLHYPSKWHRRGRRGTKRMSKDERVDHNDSGRSRDAEETIMMNPQKETRERKNKSL